MHNIRYFAEKDALTCEREHILSGGGETAINS